MNIWRKQWKKKNRLHLSQSGLGLFSADLAKRKRVSQQDCNLSTLNRKDGFFPKSGWQRRNSNKIAQLSSCRSDPYRSVPSADRVGTCAATSVLGRGLLFAETEILML